jgi:hypothetical protein
LLLSTARFKCVCNVANLATPWWTFFDFDIEHSDYCRVHPFIRGLTVQTLNRSDCCTANNISDLVTRFLSQQVGLTTARYCTGHQFWIFLLQILGSCVSCGVIPCVCAEIPMGTLAAQRRTSWVSCNGDCSVYPSEFSKKTQKYFIVEGEQCCVCLISSI